MAEPLQAIVGLGNPGAGYRDTRHNAGFWLLDALARDRGAELRPNRRLRGETATTIVGAKKLWLLKPDTFVNRSGDSVAALANYYKIPAPAMLVVYDELDLPPGVVRFKSGGGHGGHNGLRDIIARLGRRDFQRLRIGIGHPGNREAVVGYVLGRPSAGDRDAILGGIDAALALMDRFAAGEWDAATQHLHTQTSPKGGDEKQEQ